MTKKAKAIIFDLEGVVIDSEKLWTAADLLFLKKEGVDINKDQYEREVKMLLMGMAFNQGIRIFKKHLGLKGKTQDLLNKRRLIVDQFLQNIDYVKGFTKFYDKVKKTYKTAIATALVRYFLDPIVVNFRLIKLFNGHVYSIEDIGFIPKPSPDIFLHAAKKLGLHPFECIGIEDSPKGIEAVNAAGMKSIAITSTTPRDKLSRANFVIDSFSEIDLNKL